MILVDSSAWIEFLRGSGSHAHQELARLMPKHPLGVTDAVTMEVLAGARDDRHLTTLRGLLGRADLLPCESADFLTAAALYRQCRANGETVRRPIDCLIAAVAIRHDTTVLHHDADFDTLARHTRLRVHRARG